MKTRAEHLLWCKDRALEYVEQEMPASAFTSFVCDVAKHPETEKVFQGREGLQLLNLGMTTSLGKDKQQMRDWINGFN